MFIVDLAVPRDVEPEVDRLDDVYVYTVDDLGKVVSEGKQSRQAAISQAETIISLRVGDFVDWLRLRAAVPTIQSLRDRANSSAMMNSRGHCVTCIMATNLKKCLKCSPMGSPINFSMIQPFCCATEKVFQTMTVIW